MWRDRRAARPGLHRHARARPGTSSRRSPGPSGRRTGSRCPRASRARVFAERWTRSSARPTPKRFPVEGADYDLGHGDVVIAAITSCTNTSNPYVMIGAGLRRAQGARARPEGQALGQDLARAGQPGRHRLSREGRPAEDLDALGFNLVGYGCTTCIGNSGPLPEPISKAINDNDSSPLGAVGQPQLRGPRHRPTCGPTTSPRRRWSSPMRSPATSTSTSPPSRSAPGQTASRSTSRTSGPRTKEIAELVART
jgi:hypothetical protein